MARELDLEIKIKIFRNYPHKFEQNYYLNALVCIGKCIDPPSRAAVTGGAKVITCKSHLFDLIFFINEKFWFCLYIIQVEKMILVKCIILMTNNDWARFMANSISFTRQDRHAR